MYRKLKAQAAEQGRSIKELVLRGVEKELGSQRGPKGRIQLPLLRSKEPGVLHLTNEQIYEIVPFP
jgi:hypothetical protein